MSETYFWSDPHLNHLNSLRWRPQFDSMEEMNEAIIEEYNRLITPQDTVHILGDVCLGDSRESAAMVSRLNGKKHLKVGNHDTDAKLRIYAEENVFETIMTSERIKLGRRNLFLCHYPMLVANFTENPEWVIHGHTHQLLPFSAAAPQNIHVGYETFTQPISIDEIASLILTSLS